MKTVKQACTPRASVFDPARRDTVLDLTDLVDGRIDPAGFFAENHVTEGMKTLLAEGFRRLEGKSAQGVFKLTQAMGGGKTHNLLALGLLAKHPEHRAGVMGGFYAPDPDLGPVRVVAFSGRESDAPLGIWGVVAGQLGRKEQFNDYYAPLAAPGQTAWVNLLRGEPLVIMLDELPPYFVNAASKSIGNSDLSAVTTTALSNLLVAVGRDELRNVCLVISDLKASYGAGAARIGSALDDLEAETGRAAMNLEPVRMNTDEFYRILRKRIFETLPEEAEIGEVAQGYAGAVREAKQMDVTNASPEQFARQVAESYPFHPALRDLYGRFRENQGFQQTRGLIRLMRIVVSRIWATGHDPYLIAAHDLDPGSRETLTEINQINPTLENAIAHDVASGGNAVAETIDANLGGGGGQGGSEDAQDVMRLLLVASLANVPNAVKGLAVPEIVAHLCAPGRDVSRLQNEVVARLVTAAWYLHATNDGRLHLRNVQNLIARVTTTAGAYVRDQATKELKERLTEIFEPAEGACYQRLQPLPAVDGIDVHPERVTLVVAEPNPAGLHPDLVTLYEQLTYRNRICFLTGQRAFDSLLERARELKAIRQIIGEMHEEGVSDGDPQMQQARDQLLPRFLAQFHSAVRETFTTLYYPTRDRLAKVDFLMEFKENRYDGEEQVVAALADRQKYTTDVASETFRKKVEARLFTQRSMLWTEIRRRAATAPGWQWHRPDALDRMKADCFHKDVWREEGSYVNKGPFPKPATTVRIRELHRDDDTGVARLRLSPVHGDTLYAEFGGKATPASMKLDGGDFETADLKVSFLAVDSTGGHDTGEPVEWSNRITLKSREYVDARPGRLEAGGGSGTSEAGDGPGMLEAEGGPGMSEAGGGPGMPETEGGFGMPEAGDGPGMLEAGGGLGMPEAGDGPGTPEAGARSGMREAEARPSRLEAGGGERMVEIRAAPPAVPIRYTTDGSDPAVAGGAYTEPFAVPAGARLILAVAGKDGIVSEVHRREIADKPVEQPIDRTRPATWTPPTGFRFETTRTAYGFIARLKKHDGVAGGLRISVQAEGGGTWSELNFSEDLALDATGIERAVEALREIVADGEVSIEARRIRYGTGQRLLDYVAETRAEYKRDDVEQ